MAKRTIMLGADISEAEAAMGFITGMSKEISTNRYQGAVISFVHSELSQEFDTTMDAMAASNPAAFGHVYEWRMAGSPTGRLWIHNLSGVGANKTATWQWLPSREPILTPEERASDPYGTNDPMGGVAPEDIERLSGRTYYFYWKAPMMEYNMNVYIRPRWAKALFIPMWDAEDGFIFSRGVSQGAGGPNTTGQFTGAWTTWWATVAPSAFNRGVQNTIERDLGVSEKELGRATRKRRKKFKLGASTNTTAAFNTGAKSAEAMIRRYGSKYEAAAKSAKVKSVVFGGFNG